MDSNPYSDPESSLEPPPARGPSMKSRILWFAIGFIASWTIWSVMNYRAYSPRDYTQTLPEEFREGQPDWMKNAQVRRVGHFTIVAANDPQKASAHVFPGRSNRNPGRNPGVAYEDTDSDDLVDSLFVTDAKHRTFEFLVADGSFQFYNYSPDLIAKDSVSFFDYDMDGHFDFRFGPGRRFALMVDSQWHDLFPEAGSTGYVELLDGTRVPAENVNGMWRIVE